MGKMTLEEIRDAIHDLSEEDRIELLGGLIDSFNSEMNRNAEKQNLVEIKRRIQMARENPSLWLDGDEVMAELESELHAKI